MMASAPASIFLPRNTRKMRLRKTGPLDSVQDKQPSQIHGPVAAKLRPDNWQLAAAPGAAALLFVLGRGHGALASEPGLKIDLLEVGAGFPFVHSGFGLAGARGVASAGVFGDGLFDDVDP